MHIQTASTTGQDWSGDLLAVGIFEEHLELTGDLASLNQTLAGLLQELIQESEFKAKFGKTLFSRVGNGARIRKLLVVGLGKTADFSLDHLRRAAATIARQARKEKCKSVGISLPVWQRNGQSDPAMTAQALAEGVSLALHQDNRFKSDLEESNGLNFPEQVALLGLGEQAAALERAQKVCAGVILARELVNAPANVITPVTLADAAIKIAQEQGLSVEILEKADCERLGMGAFLGVAQASDLPPKFIHLTYKPNGTPRRKLGIIGKGLTFDSGGLNIKPTGSGIETMKMDMAGSAATLGAAFVVGQLKPDVEVHFLVAATENMISGKAIHPGDILTAANGKTIEINNTDAEGRLTLADALVFAETLGLDAMVDLATLTGACIVALGDDIGGLWSPDDGLAEQLNQAAQHSGEKFWRMPLEDKYFEGLKSNIADMKNTGPRAGGSITAALFLKQFVKDTPWAHLDIAGPVWTEKEAGYNNSGATGFGVRTLVNWVQGQ
jgi:leucyl aminopeptidase